MSPVVEANRQKTARMPRAAEPASAGQVGSWRLTRLVSEGRLCRVYQAGPVANASLKTAAYALKLLSPQWHDETAAVACIEREALIGRALSHAHLVPVLAAHTTTSPYYVIMPWLSGTTLRLHLQQQEKLAPAAAFWIVRQIAEALQALHEAGWIHGDVKPDNILLSPQRHATLLDLGFARRLGEPVSHECMQGTIAYMAPETFDGCRADLGSDLYSLGVTLYEMLTGRVPFAGRNMAEIIRDHRGTRPDQVRRRLPDLSREAAALISTMLAKEPLRRPQSSHELVDQLVRLELSLLAAR